MESIQMETKKQTNKPPTFQKRILYSPILSFKNEGQIKTSSDTKSETIYSRQTYITRKSKS